MPKRSFALCALLFVFSALTPLTAALKECSPETVNGDCTLTIDRAYPVMYSSLQMRPGKKVYVRVQHPLPFEILSLDFQSGQAVEGTDETAQLASQMLSNVKVPAPPVKPAVNAPIPLPCDKGADFEKHNSEFCDTYNNAKGAVESLQNDDNVKALIGYAKSLKQISQNGVLVYAQLNEVLNPIPPEELPAGTRSGNNGVLKGFPLPWMIVVNKCTDHCKDNDTDKQVWLCDKNNDTCGDYTAWRKDLLCEIGGTDCDITTALSDSNPAQNSILALGSGLKTPPDPSKFPDAMLKSAQDALKVAVSKAGTIAINQHLAKEMLYSLGLNLEDIAELRSTLPLIAGGPVTTITTDLQNYYSNIQTSLLVDKYGQGLDTNGNPVPGQCETSDKQGLTCLVDLIHDPKDRKITDESAKNRLLSKYIGRSVTYYLNAVNEVSTSALAVNGTVKKQIVQITVVYGDPRFEVSTGAIFSWRPFVSSYVNQTQVITTSAGCSPNPAPCQGNVTIEPTPSGLPAVTPFVAGNWRIGNDFNAHFLDKRGAVYGTVGVGLNPTNTLPEYVAGLSFSWRTLMFSALADWGYNASLNQGETAGSVWCNAGATKCSPPNPDTSQVFSATPGVAFGVSVRVPNIFSGSSTSASSGGASGSGSGGSGGGGGKGGKGKGGGAGQ